MATPFSCKGEVFSSGGPGIFLLGRAEALSQTLAAEYEGSVTLIYLDPPIWHGRYVFGKAFFPKSATHDPRLCGHP